LNANRILLIVNRLSIAEVFEIHVRLELSKGLTSQSSTTHTHIYNQPPLHIIHTIRRRRRLPAARA